MLSDVTADCNVSADQADIPTQAYPSDIFQEAGHDPLGRGVCDHIPRKSWPSLRITPGTGTRAV